MKVKLLKTWSGQPVGHVFRGMHRGMGLTLQQRGIAEVIEDEPKPRAMPKKPRSQPASEPVSDDQQVETTTETEPGDGANRPSGKRRGRKKTTGNP